MPRDEWLRFEEIGLGSFTAILTAIGRKWKSVKTLGLLLYPKGMEHIRRRVDAQTEMQEEDVETKRLHNERERVRLELDQLKLEKDRFSARVKQLEEIRKLDAKLRRIKNPRDREAWLRGFDKWLGDLNVVREDDNFDETTSQTTHYGTSATP